MNLNEMTRNELYSLTKKFNISGRSKMTKAQMIDALSAPDIASLVELTISLDETAAIEADAQTMQAINEAEAEAAYIEAGLERDAEAGTYSFGTNALVTRDAPGSAYVNLETSGINTAGITRRGNRFELISDTGVTIRARSIAKAVKAWAKRLGVTLDSIETVKQF